MSRIKTRPNYIVGVTFEDIIALVSEETGIPRGDIRRPGRTPMVVLARRLVAWLAYETTDMSWPQITLAIYGRRKSHSGVHYGAAAIAGAIEFGDRFDLAGRQEVASDYVSRLMARLSDDKGKSLQENRGDSS